jgi:RNA recognition motif-containing protein
MSKDLYVKNLTDATGEEELRTLFAVAGKVSYIHLVKDPRSGDFCGSAYVKMATEAQAKEAIELLDGAWVNNRLIGVSIARPQQPVGSAPAPRSAKPGSKPGNKFGAKPAGKFGSKPTGKPGAKPAGKSGSKPPGRPGPSRGGRS